MDGAAELRALSAQDSQNLSDLHDAYRTFCEYGWHHLTWKNLAYSLTTYLSAYFKQDADGHLLHTRSDLGCVQYLADLNVETFGYLTKDALWVLFRRTGFGNDYELNLGDHRPFQTPAWQYLLLLSQDDLQALIVDVANILRDRTTSSHASANILSLTPDWRPTFGAEYGIFRYFEVQLSTTDAISLSYVQLERQAALQPFQARSKNFLRRALSRQIVDDTVKEEDFSDTESVQYSRCRNVGLGIPDDSTKESPIADSPTLAPTPAPNVPPLSALDSSLDTNLNSERSVSPTSGHQSFVTAKTVPSDGLASRTASRMTRTSSLESFLSFESMVFCPPVLCVSEYYRLLEAQNLPPEPAAETDWSGRGQHAEFSLAERYLVPLQKEKLLGSTRTAIVESVRCKRVRLVRKTIRCTRWTGVKREDVLREVQHLYRAQHAHIVRLVGSYAIGPDLAILTYPCAEWNLEEFMRFARTAHRSTGNCASALRQFFTCTAKVMDFLHSFPIKHMDIKPQNLFVRDISTSDADEQHQCKLYFTEFGISKAYKSVDECDTESPTSFTRTYAAHEVGIQESRGLSADMFSLGCVYSEMLATILDGSIASFEPQDKVIDVHWAALRAARRTSESDMRPYHRATEDVRTWLYRLPIEREPEMMAVREWTAALLSNEASAEFTDSKPFNMLWLLLFLSVTSAKLHHFYVGQISSTAVHALELDDELRTLYEMGIIPTTTAAPSLVIDHSRKFLFSSSPQDGTLTRYAIQADYSLVTEANTTIPASCNATAFSTLHLTPSNQAPYSIYGSASTGNCSVIFSTSISGFKSLRSKEFAGDIRSLAWSPNGHHLHALDSRSSQAAATSILNFYISDDDTLNAQNQTDILANVTNAEQMVTHPTGNLVYVVTKDSNELVTMPLQGSEAPASPSRFKILPSSMDASQYTQYTTLSLTITSSKTSLWTLSQSPAQVVVTVFSLDATTGTVIGAVARAGWTGDGAFSPAQIAPAPFFGNDIVAVTNSPVGYTAFLGLDKGTAVAGETGDIQLASEAFLEDVWMLNVKSDAVAAPKLKSYGRIALAFDSLGEGVWVD
ncbi:hypothetical protein PMIN07_012041 [Paraphaeosphaeria minitans]